MGWGKNLNILNFQLFWEIYKQIKNPFSMRKRNSSVFTCHNSVKEHVFVSKTTCVQAKGRKEIEIKFLRNETV